MSSPCHHPSSSSSSSSHRRGRPDEASHLIRRRRHRRRLIHPSTSTSILMLRTHVILTHGTRMTPTSTMFYAWCIPHNPSPDATS
eukprot:10839759-Karenia_brevis.AAC.1